LFDLWAWLTLTPHHTYLIISWKWQYKKLDKNIFILALIITIISFLYILFSLFI
jgi:hypothetical protein